MVEPVGNEPRRSQPKPDRTLSELTGNSHKERQSTSKEVAEREPVEKIVEGKVIVRSLPWYKKIARNMIAEDAGNVGEYILMDVVVPATKNLLLDMLYQTGERLLFGTSRGRLSSNRRSPLGAIFRDREPVNYGRYSERDVRGGRPLSHRARATHDFNEVVLEHRSEAIDVIESLVDLVARYGAATVADLYDLLGTTGSYVDRQWGWTDLITADVRQVPGGFLLDLPAPEPITSR
jgi:hypothetical protein